MARHPPKAPPRLALFDRLLQGDSVETDKNADRAMRELRESVRRDLEILFNTRPRHLPLDPALEELQKSLLAFGLPSLQGQHVATPTQQRKFQDHLQSIIQRFEPRFRDLTVQLVQNQDWMDRVMRLQIHAILETDTASEAVVYDTMIDPVSGGLVIKEG